MSVSHVGEFRAKPERTDDLRAFLVSILPGVRAAAGCEGCSLLQSQDDPTTFIVLEIWESVEAHRASANDIPPEMINQIMPLLAAPPNGRYYHVVTER